MGRACSANFIRSLVRTVVHPTSTRVIAPPTTLATLLEALAVSKSYLEEPARLRREFLSRRFYKVGFIISAVLNVLLIWGFWYYTQIEDTLSMIWSAVEIAN